MFSDATRRYGVRTGNHGSSFTAIRSRGIKDAQYVSAMTMLDKELYLARDMHTPTWHPKLIEVNKPPLLS